MLFSRTWSRRPPMDGGSGGCGELAAPPTLTLPHKGEGIPSRGDYHAAATALAAMTEIRWARYSALECMSLLSPGAGTLLALPAAAVKFGVRAFPLSAIGRATGGERVC